MADPFSHPHKSSGVILKYSEHGADRHGVRVPVLVHDGGQGDALVLDLQEFGRVGLGEVLLLLCGLVVFAQQFLPRRLRDALLDVALLHKGLCI